MSTADIEPVIASINVQATPTRAFEFFTAGMSRWWLPTQTVSPSRPLIHQDDPVAKVVPAIELRVGGRWYERATDGSAFDWGRVLVWEPPKRLVLAWQIDAKWHFDPTLLTEIEVRFDAQASGATEVNIEHRGLERYGAAATAVRTALASSEGWSGQLKDFAAALTQSEPKP
ncbi:SRPBCC family protein [Caballeronia mineralivorans]|uniref:SRPBCC family protein n=1 Tax=Caballeronia mineralivorans TaxID=2010198 RepID=UPI001910FAFA|nr:SRPBCC family protein [Caballeronia mineralivorans]